MLHTIKTKAFTLVELIVVITILAILWTIWFISLQWYSANARDSVRIANLTNMDKWLAILQAKDWPLPLPEWSVTTITSSWSHILTQWEFTQSMAEQLLKMSGDITDPVDSINPIYTTSSDKKYYQVALFLEAENLAIANINSRDRKYSVPTEILQNTHAADWKTFISRWSKLWVIMTDTETPVNQTTDIIPPTTLELNTTTTHIAYLDESTKIETSWTDLSEVVVTAVANAASVVGSCKEVLDKGLWNTSWLYDIIIDWEQLRVYCDMTTDWGGWTLVHKTTSSPNDLTWDLTTTEWVADWSSASEYRLSINKWKSLSTEKAMAKNIRIDWEERDDIQAGYINDISTSSVTFSEEDTYRIFNSWTMWGVQNSCTSGTNYWNTSCCNRCVNYNAGSYYGYPLNSPMVHVTWTSTTASAIEWAWGTSDHGYHRLDKMWIFLR